MDATLTKTETLMDLSEVTGDFVTFVARYDDTLITYRRVVLTYADWVDMGSPREITSTVVPGDALNP